jgi:AcrR family transcriptional regulator
MALSPERRSARQRHLVQVAQSLIREGGDAGFSMAQLAKRGGVSPATPYNLLGAKSDILRLIVRDEFERFAEKFAGVRSSSPLGALLDATALVVTHYEADRAFYRGLFRATFGMEASEVYPLMAAEGHALWGGLVAGAIRSGELESFVRVEPVTSVVLGIITIITQAWLVEGWSEDRYALEMAHAIRLCLASVATAPTREALVRQIALYQPRIAAAHAKPAPPSALTQAAG